MCTGEIFYILDSLLILDIESQTTLYNDNSITDLCVTDLFGNVKFHSDKLDIKSYDILKNLLNNKVVIAFDSNQDRNFLIRDCESLRINLFHIEWFCAKQFLENVYKRKDLSLKKVCKKLGIKYPNHTALSDCKSLASIIRKVIKQMPETFNPTYRDLLLLILETFKNEGMDYLPAGDNLPLGVLIKEIEDGTKLGEQYLEIIRSLTLDELTSRGAFATNIQMLKRGDSDNTVT